METLQQQHAMTSMVKALQSVGVDDLGATADDEVYLREVLGHSPRGWWRVMDRDEHGRARVIVTYPLWVARKVSRPFPNLFWLTDATLIARISELERVGTISQLEQALESDVDFRLKVDVAHRDYAALRWAMLDEAARTFANENGFTDALQWRGVGGLTRGSFKIKCLHAHTAHHLVMARTGSANEVGRRVMAMLD